MTLLHALSYVGVVGAFAFVILSLASGLLWIAELIEEHSTTSKTIGIRGIYTIIVLHVLLFLFDSLPFPQIAFSIACHVVYLRNFSHTWPFISLSSPSFLASCILCMANHFMWFFYFSHRAQEARHRAHRSYRGPASLQDENLPRFVDIATFFATCVWLVPLFLFLSLSANDNALPTASDGEQCTTIDFTDDPNSLAGHTSSPTSYSTPIVVTTSHSSLFKTLFDSMPRIRPKRRVSEGIIAPRSPLLSAPTSPTFAPNQMFPQSPMHSPSLGPPTDHGAGREWFNPGLSGKFEAQSRSKAGMKLSRPPPRRSATNPINRLQVSRKSTEDVDSSSGGGLGFRKRLDGDSGTDRRFSGDRVNIPPSNG